MNLQELAKASYTQDFTGADLKALLYNAQLSAVHKALDERRLKSRSRVSVTSEGSPDTSIKSGGGGHQSPMVFKWTEEGVQQQPAVPTDIELKVWERGGQHGRGEGNRWQVWERFHHTGLRVCACACRCPCWSPRHDVADSCPQRVTLWNVAPPSPAEGTRARGSNKWWSHTSIYYKLSRTSDLQYPRQRGINTRECESPILNPNCPRDPLVVCADMTSSQARQNRSRDQ